MKLRFVQVATGWPAGLTWDQALAYTSFSPSQLKHCVKAGRIQFRRVGRNGLRVVLRAQLDDILEQIFGSTPNAIEEDFDFG